MKKTKSIVTVASYGGPYSGNFIPSLIACSDAIHELGYRSVFIFPGFTEDYGWVPQMRAAADEVYFVPYHPYSLDNVLRIRRICKEENGALIYSRMSGWDITARLAMPRLPQIWHMEMGLSLDTKKKWAKYWVKYRVLGFGRTYHVAVSEKVADVIDSLHTKHSCEWIPNAILFSRLHEKPPYAFSSPVKLLVFAYDPFVKGLDLALDACEKLNATEQRFVLLASAQKDTYRYVEDRYAGGKPEWLELLPPTNVISDIYDRADIILSPSRSEGFPYGLTEALYSGLPAVMSDIPGTSWAKEMKMVRVFLSGDADALAAMIANCAEEQVTEEAQSFNRSIIAQKYSLQAWTRRVRAVIEQALA